METNDQVGNRHPVITDEELEDLREIDRLLHEANQHSLDGDGTCKSAEGHISLGLGNHWDRIPDSLRKPVTVEIYAYLLGPSRSHHFDTTKQALEVVRQWHRREMSFDYSTGEYTSPNEPDLYLALQEQRDRDFSKAMRVFEDEMG